MGNLFQRMFNKGRDATDTTSNNTTANDAPRKELSAEEEYKLFCSTFKYKDGRRFVDWLKAEDVTLLLEWLSSKNEEAEPKAFIRLVNDATYRGIDVWKQKGVDMYMHGNWSKGGCPSQKSQDALSVLAQILEMPINFYYKITEDGETMLMTFEP